MLLWNALVPQLFSGPNIGYGQAIGLLVLTHILFRGGPPAHHRHSWGHWGWRGRMEEKMAGMSPEEKARFKEMWEKRCGRGAGPFSPSVGNAQE
jgi:hypothetical protein